MKILQVSTIDIAGGAERIAWTLHQGYHKRGHQSWLAVGQKISDNSEVLPIPNNNYRNPWAKFWLTLAEPLLPLAKQKLIAAKLHGLLTRAIAQPQRWRQRQLGYEDFDAPATAHLLTLTPQKPDLVHCHNLHGDYFDLRVLPFLSQQLPLILTLHDAWLLSGHCAHSFDCDRWKTGCGECPDLSIPPAIKQDQTAYNWQRKQEIYRQSRFYIATPSRWLMSKVENSILATGIIEKRVIPNGIDLSLFHPTDKKAIRVKLGLPLDSKIILFTANGIRKNPWKDYQTMQTAVALVAQHLEQEKILFIALGENSPPEHIGQAQIQFIPYQKDPKTVAGYYQAADVYVHAAKADTFPNTVLEALACGTPVVGTAVGGIPEQIIEEVTGFLAPLGNPESMANSIQKLLENPDLHQSLSEQAALIAQKNYSLDRMVEDYIKWYRSILEDR